MYCSYFSSFVDFLSGLVHYIYVNDSILNHCDVTVVAKRNIIGEQPNVKLTILCHSEILIEVAILEDQFLSRQYC